MRYIIALALVATATAKIDGLTAIPTGTGVTATGKDDGDCADVCREYGREHAECGACMKGINVKKYCKKMPETCGCSDGICGTPTGTDGGGGGEMCCEAMTLECMVCSCENDGMIVGLPAKDCSQHNVCEMATSMLFMCIPGCKCDVGGDGGDDYLMEGDECVPTDFGLDRIPNGGIRPRRRLTSIVFESGTGKPGKGGNIGIVGAKPQDRQPSGGITNVDAVGMLGKCAPGLKCMASRDFVIGGGSFNVNGADLNHKLFTCQWADGGNSGGDECGGDQGCMCDMKCSMMPGAGTANDDGTCFDKCMGNSTGGNNECKDEDWDCKCKMKCKAGMTTHADMQGDDCWKDCMTNTPSPGGDGDVCRRGQTEDMCWSIAGCMWWMQPSIDIGFPTGIRPRRRLTLPIGVIAVGDMSGGNGGGMPMKGGKCVPDSMDSDPSGGDDCPKKCMEIGGMDSKKIWSCLTEQCGMDVEWGAVECAVNECFARGGVSNLATLGMDMGGMDMGGMDMMMKMGKCACDACGFCLDGGSNGSDVSDPLGRCHDKCTMMMENMDFMDMNNVMGSVGAMDKCFMKCETEHGGGHVDPDGACIQRCDRIYNEASEGCGDWCDGEELADGSWDDSMCGDKNDRVDRCYDGANKRYSECMCKECNDEWMCQELEGNNTMDKCHSDCEVHNQDINWEDMTDDEAHEAGIRFDDCMCACDNKMTAGMPGYHYDQCEVDRCFNKCSWKMDRSPTPIRRRLQKKQPGTSTVGDVKNGGVFKPNGGGNLSVGGIGGNDGGDPAMCHMKCDRMWDSQNQDVSQGAMHTTIENCHKRCMGEEPDMRDNCDPQQEDCHVNQGGNGTTVDPIDVNDGNKRCMKECMAEKSMDNQEATKKHCYQRCGEGTDTPVDPVDVNDGDQMCMKECMKNQKQEFMDQHPTDAGDANQDRFKKFCMKQCGDGSDPTGNNGTGSGMNDDWWRMEQERYRCENECQLLMEPPQCRRCMQKDNQRMVEEMNPSYWDRWEAMDSEQQCIHDMEKDLSWIETDKCMCECGNDNWCGDWTDQNWDSRESDTRKMWDCENAGSNGTGSGHNGSSGCGPACPNGEDLWCENWAHDDAGCPMCMCDDKPMGCTWEGTSYEEGDQWKLDDGCNSCWCKNGEAMCTEQACHHECDTVDCEDAMPECDNSRYIPPNYDEDKCCGHYDNADCPQCEPMTDGACACEEGQLEIWFADATTQCDSCYCEQIDFGSGGSGTDDQDACTIGADYVKDKNLKKTLKKVNKKIKKFCKFVKKCTKAGDGPETCKKAKAGGVDRQVKDIQEMIASVDCEDSVNFGGKFNFPSMDKMPCSKKIMSAWEKAGQNSGGDGGDKCSGLNKKKCNKKEGCTFDGDACLKSDF